MADQDSSTDRKPRAKDDELDRGVKIFYLCIMVLLVYGTAHSIMRIVGAD